MTHRGLYTIIFIVILEVKKIYIKIETHMALGITELFQKSFLL